VGGSLLDEIVRDGARQMLAAALQAEVAAYIDAHVGEVDENGHRGAAAAVPARTLDR
jgi:putative transposase